MGTITIAIILSFTDILVLDRTRDPQPISSHLMLSSPSLPLLNCDKQKNKANKRHFKLGKKLMLYWIDLLKKHKQDCTHVDHNHLEPFLSFKKYSYTYIVQVLKSVALIQPRIGVNDLKWCGLYTLGKV